MEALRSLLARVRAHPWVAVGIVAAALLTAAWLAWAIYVASDRGVNEGLGVLIGWPAIVAAIALISLPFIGGYRLIRRLSTDSGASANPAETAEREPEEPEEGEEEEGPRTSSEEDADEESEPEPETATS